MQKGFDASTTTQFRRFFASPLFDRLARACLQHFLARFEHDLLCKARVGNTFLLQKVNICRWHR